MLGDRDGRVSALLEWAGPARRDLPWRHHRDPWLVLVSEVMLQQTQVERVVEPYLRFAQLWPDAASLAQASLADVLVEWQGLGFPRRARNLHRCARELVRDHRGQVPLELEALLALPGIGPYTARAVLVFAAARDVGVVDTNVARLFARWTGETLSASSAQRLADEHVPTGRGWEWTQGLFDFASAVCTKRSPRCGDCPVEGFCAWRGQFGPDPAIGSAGVSRPQARFEDSDRQRRGRLMRALASGPVASCDAGAVMGEPNPERARTIVRTLASEGLISVDGEVLRLGS